MKIFVVPDQSQDSNHTDVLRKKLNGSVEQMALYRVAGCFSDTEAQVQLQIKASKFKWLHISLVSILPLL